MPNIGQERSTSWSECSKKWQPRTSAIRENKGETLADKSDFMERWTEYCSKPYKNEEDSDTVEELIKELDWILPLQER